MASFDEAQQALTDAIANLAARASDAPNGQAASSYAASAKDLAEAAAWMRAPSNPH